MNYNVTTKMGDAPATTSTIGMTFHIKRQYETEVPDHVEVHGDLGEAGCNNPQLLDACLRRIKRYEHLKKVNLFLSPRVPADAPLHNSPGWCEYLMVLTFESGCRLTVGVIQRQPGANIEFHS